MSAQMFFAFSYVPCVLFHAMYFTVKNKHSSLLRKLSIVFGGAAIWSYVIFLMNFL